MDDTDTKIAVSSISEISNFNMERIITVKGEIENMSKAEAEISSKLRAAYEADVQAMAVSCNYIYSTRFKSDESFLYMYIL